MPCLARFELPGIPLHITHRGVNRCAVFVDQPDRGVYLHPLSKQILARQVALHAYVLMGNPVHPLVSSTTTVPISASPRSRC